MPLTRDQLDAGFDHIRDAPPDRGVLDMIVCRPAINERRALTEARLDVARDLVSD